MRIRILMMSASLLVIGAALVMSPSAEPTGPTPPWVGPDGRVDFALMPERLPVLDASGAVSGYANKADLFQAPDMQAETVPLYASRTATESDSVFRLSPPEGFTRAASWSSPSELFLLAPAGAALAALLLAAWVAARAVGRRRAHRGAGGQA